MASFNSSSIGHVLEKEYEDDLIKICSFCKIILHEKCSYPCGHTFCGKCFVHFFNKSDLCYVYQLCEFAENCSIKAKSGRIINAAPGDGRFVSTQKQISSSNSGSFSKHCGSAAFGNKFQNSVSSLSSLEINDENLGAVCSENKTSFSYQLASNSETLNSENERALNSLSPSKDALSKVVKCSVKEKGYESHLDKGGNCSGRNEHCNDGLSIESNSLDTNLNRNQFVLSSETNSSQFPNCNNCNINYFHEDLEYYCITCGILFCYVCIQIHVKHKFQYLKRITPEMIDFSSQENIRPKHANFKTSEHELKKRETVCDFVNDRESNVSIKISADILQPKKIIKKKEKAKINETLDSTYDLNSSRQSLKSNCQEKESDGKGLLKISENNLYGSLKTGCVNKKKSNDLYLEVGGQALDFLIFYNYIYFFIELRNHLGERIKFNGKRPKAILTFPNSKYCRIKLTNFDDIFYRGCIYTNKKGKHIINISLKEISNLEYPVFTKKRKSIHDIVKNIDIISHQISEMKGWGLCCSKDGTIYATDTVRNCIWVFNSRLKNINKIGRGGKGDGEFCEPWGITIDELERIIVVDKGNHRIQVWTRYGKFLFAFGGHGNSIGKLDHPWGVATNSLSEIAVTDSINNKVHLFDYTGGILASKNLCINKNETDNLKEFCPQGLCFYEDNIIFVAEFYQHYIHRLQINKTSKELIHCQIIVIAPPISIYKIRNNLHALLPIKEIQGILITEKYMVIAETEFNRIFIISMNKIDKTINNTGTTEDYKIYKIESTNILPIYDRNFQLCNIAVCQDGHLLAINNKDRRIYKLRGK